MKEFTVAEAKARLDDLLRIVESGETIAISRRGRPIAHLVSAKSTAAIDKEEALERFARHRRRWKSARAGIEEILDWRHREHRS